MRPRMSGSTCARTGSQTGSSLPTPTWSTIAVRLGTSSSTAPGSSCPSACASGLTGPNHRDLVLYHVLVIGTHAPLRRPGTSNQGRSMRLFQASQQWSMTSADPMSHPLGDLVLLREPRKFLLRVRTRAHSAPDRCEAVNRAGRL